jgi:hypothetical protein
MQASRQTEKYNKRQEAAKQQLLPVFWPPLRARSQNKINGLLFLFFLTEFFLTPPFFSLYRRQE